jgi:hypothetical protein
VKVEITDGYGVARLLEEAAFTEFCIAAPEELDLSVVDSALRQSGAGLMAGTQALISISWIKSQATVTQDWLAGFDAMLAFAGSRGWLSADGKSVRGHVERF